MSARAFPVIVFGLATLLLGGCSGKSAFSDGKGKRTAVATTIPQAWIVRQIAGEAMDVWALVRPGQSAELYQPTDAELARMAAADVYFRTGMPIEESRGIRGLHARVELRMVDLREGITLRDLNGHACRHGADGDAGDDHAGHADGDSPGGEATAKDPHIWLDPQLVKHQARSVAAVLSELIPEKKELFQRNLAALEQRFDEVDREVEAILKPHRGKAFFVFHPGWGYFASRYGLREIAVETDGKEPSDSHLTELQQTARREGVRVVFVQPQFTGRAAEAVASAIGGRVEVLDDLAPELDAGLLDAARRLAASYP